MKDRGRGQSSLAIKKVDIRPGVSVLSVLKHLNYRPWFALAEFIDNSIQSFTFQREKLQSLHGKDTSLKVIIDIEAGPPIRLSVKDNAAGIAQADYPRAFRPAAVPPDTSGLSEFGMGMKSAACWFAPRWEVRTSALGEPVERLIRFDINKIVDDQIEELEIKEKKASKEAHFTEVVLEDLHHFPVGRTIAKIKDHLTDIYRVFLRAGTLELIYDDKPLHFVEPKVLVASDFKNLDGPKLEWRKDISFDFGDGMSVEGFAALREKANVSQSGFALFRRGRLIQGSGDEGYRPEMVFGKSNSFRYQRLIGELHLSGFEISHTKDGFRWDENEQPFLELLKEHLNEESLPLLKQAEGHRALKSRTQLSKLADQAVKQTAEALGERLPGVLPGVSDEPPVETSSKPLEEVDTLAKREIRVGFRDQDWLIKVEITNDPAEGQWLSMSNYQPTAKDPQTIEMRVNLAHPFMVRFAQNDSEDVEALLRIAAALGLAETLARQSGVKMAGTVRRNLNEILLEALSQA